ncbi:MAG: hypothetical protein KAH01_04435 [Caldisericia bacterium]|nr:hypothetical protein [Caldisericia bacterium]
MYKLTKLISTSLAVLLLFTLIPTLTVTKVTHAESSFVNKQICANENNRFVLDTEKCIVEIYNRKNKKLSQFTPAPKIQSFPPIPVDIQCDDEHIYVLDQKANSIFVFDTKGEFEQIIPDCHQYLNKPISFQVKNNMFFVADNQNIFTIDNKGILSDKKSFPSVNGVKPRITNIMYNKELFVVTNSSQINEWNDYKKTWNNPICRFGQEANSFLNISAAAFSKNGYVFDTTTNSFFMYNNVLKTWTRLNELDFSNVTDCFILDSTMFIVESDKTGYSNVDLEKLLGKPNYALSSKSIEFQNSSVNYLTEILYIWSTNGLPLKGTVNSSHEGISIEPNKFCESDIYLTIQIDKNKFADAESIRESISINLDNEKPIDIPVKGYLIEKNNFAVKNDHDATINSSSALVLTIETNNSFNDTLSVDIIKPNENYTFSSENVEIKENDRKGSAILKFSPKSNLNPGFYPISIKVTSKKYKILKQYTFVFRYEKTDLVQKTVLGELFTAPWCDYCHSAEKAIEEVHKILSTDDICFVTYLIECVHDDQLCTPQTKDRKLWYDVTGTPTIMFNGTEKKIGGINSKTESMIHKYMPIIKNLQSENSSISLSTWSSLTESKSFEENDSKKKIVNVSSRIESLRKLPEESDLSFYSILIENNVVRPKKGEDGDDEVVEALEPYNYVFRTMNNSMGQSLNSGKTVFGYNKNTCNISTNLIVPDYVNIDNCLILTFVQNNTTKNILQTRVVSIDNAQEEQKANLISMQKNIATSNDKDFHAYYQITNTGNKHSKYSISLEPIDSTVKTPLEIFINGELVPNNMLDLIPHQTKQFTVTGNISTLKNTSALKVSVENSNMLKVQTSIVPFKSYANNFAKIISPSSEDLIIKKRPMFVIQTLPGTKIIGKDYKTLSISGSDGILYYTPKTELGTNNLIFNLKFPDGTSSNLEYSFFLGKEVFVTLGNNTYMSYGIEKKLSLPIIIIKGRSLASIMFVSMAIECNTNFYGGSKEILLTNNDHKILLQPNNNEAFVDEKKYILDVPPSIYHGIYYCPLRFVVESFDFNIFWNPVTHEIKITNLKE